MLCVLKLTKYVWWGGLQSRTKVVQDHLYRTETLRAGNGPEDGQEMVILREASVEKMEILIDCDFTIRRM